MLNMVIFEKKVFFSGVPKKKLASRVIFCPPINIKWPLPKLAREPDTKSYFIYVTDIDFKWYQSVCSDSCLSVSSVIPIAN